MNTPGITSSPDYSPGTMEPVLAELVVGKVTNRSLVFRCYDWLRGAFTNSIGIISIIFCTSIAANIPIIQFLSFGYLLEVSGRLARGGSLQDSMVGISKAARIGGLLLGTWLLLIPVRFFSDSIWYEAHLIDSDSPQARFTRAVQLILIGLTTIQILAAWVCGGKLRYFFWQLFAPFSFGIWLMRRVLGSRSLRPILNLFFKWVSPNFVNDLCHAQPPTDWFVPAILIKKLFSGSFYVSIRDGLWNYLKSLNLWYFFKLGVVGFAGSVVWLILPTLLLIGATRLSGGAAIACGLFGAATAIPIFSVLLFVQTRYAQTLRFTSFFET